MSLLFLLLLCYSMVMLLFAEEFIAVVAITSQFAGRPFATLAMLPSTQACNLAAATSVAFVFFGIVDCPKGLLHHEGSA